MYPLTCVFSPYVNQCIGFYNHRLFFLFLLSAWMGVGGGLVLIAVSFYDSVMASTDMGWWGMLSAWDEPFFMSLLPIMLSYQSFLTSLLFPQINQVVWNITTNEFNNRDRYDYIEYPGYTPWTRLGYWQNVKDFLLYPAKIDWTRYFVIVEEV